MTIKSHYLLLQSSPSQMCVWILALPMPLFGFIVALFNIELFNLTSYIRFIIITPYQSSPSFKKNYFKGNNLIVLHWKKALIRMFLSSRYCDILHLFYRKCMVFFLFQNTEVHMNHETINKVNEYKL